MARPRSFSSEQVVEAAQGVFWRSGYQQAAIGDRSGGNARAYEILGRSQVPAVGGQPGAERLSYSG